MAQMRDFWILQKWAKIPEMIPDWGPDDKQNTLNELSGNHATYKL